MGLSKQNSKPHANSLAPYKVKRACCTKTKCTNHYQYVPCNITKCILLTKQQDQSAEINVNIKISKLATMFKNIYHALFYMYTLSTVIIIYRLSKWSQDKTCQVFSSDTSIHRSMQICLYIIQPIITLHITLKRSCKTVNIKKKNINWLFPI